jgi:hypothetical protein
MSASLGAMSPIRSWAVNLGGCDGMRSSGVDGLKRRNGI